MPVNEKILFRSFQYLFSLKSIIYAILSSAMLRENHAVFLGKKYRFPRGGGGINIRFPPKYRPLMIEESGSSRPKNRRIRIRNTAFLYYPNLHLGSRNGHWLDKLRREWQMHRAFRTAVAYFRPEAVFFLGSVADPDPHVFGPPGSGSTSQRYGSGSGSF